MRFTTIILAFAATLLFALPALACDGKSCDKKDCNKTSEEVTADAKPALAEGEQLVTIRVESATCASCHVPIRTELTALKGISNVIATDDVKELNIHVMKGSVTNEQILAAVKKAGYHATIKAAKQS